MKSLQVLLHDRDVGKLTHPKILEGCMQRPFSLEFFLSGLTASFSLLSWEAFVSLAEVQMGVLWLLKKKKSVESLVK